MKHKVIKSQVNSKKCFTCGLQNNIGLKARFFELENGELVALFKAQDEHQGYPGRLHGGLVGTILDETMGRAILIHQEDIWGVTVELKIQYHKPIPLNEELRVVGRITKNMSRMFEGTGEILLSNGDIAASAYGKYLKMPIHKITDFDTVNEEWQEIALESSPAEIEI